MIRVCLMKRRRFYEAQWRDPVTGKKRTRSTGTANSRDAERFAARLETEINESGGPREASRLTWQEFIDRYDAEKLSGLAVKTRLKMLTALNAVTRLINPSRLSAFTSQQVSKFTSLLRTETYKGRQRLESSVWSNLTCIRTAMKWAHRHRLVTQPVHVEMPKRQPGMKGRPITDEEFQRLVKQVDELIPEGKRAAWKFFLEGLWWSGLRLGEALDLHWTDDSRICVIMSGKHPMFYIRGVAEKGRKNRQLPMAPEFAKILQAIPVAERQGFIFLPNASHRPDVLVTSKKISALGKRAAISVSPKKFASAHDLRRAFGFRWAYRVMPPVLQEMMRHESITTTMEFYVGRNAETTAIAAWTAFANESANKQPKPTNPDDDGTPQNDAA